MGASATVKYHYPQCRSTYSVIRNHTLVCFGIKAFHADPSRGHIQMGSLAGAAHLLNCNADALRLTQREQKSLVD